MSGDQQYPPSGWGHRIREENRGLREKVAWLRKESVSLQKELQNTWRLLGHVPGSLILVENERILFANETACRETGYSSNELSSMEISNLLSSDLVSSALSLYQRKTGDPSSSHEREVALKTKDGKILSAELRISKAVHRGKTVFLFHMISLDQRKARERQSTEFGKTKAFLSMASGFREELELCRRLIKEDIAGRQSPGVYEEGVQKSLKEIDAIREKEALLSKRLRCMARTEYGPSELTLVDLTSLIEMAVDIAGPRVNGVSHTDADSVKIHTFLRAPSKVYGCSRELQDVFANIILNAVEALPDGGDVYLTTEEHSGFAHIYIQDNGVGMCKAVIEKVFDPFFTTKDGNWRGLGLSLSHAVIDRHQGEIRIISQEGRGSAFTIKLPMARDVALLMKTAPPRKGLRDSHILIMGEEGVLTDICYALFADICGGVTTTSSYREGLRLLKDADVDLIIADREAFRIDMSKSIGRMKGLRPELAVVLIDAAGTSGFRGTEGKTGADLIVKRPLDMDRFVSQVAGLMGEGGAPE